MSTYKAVSVVRQAAKLLSRRRRKTDRSARMCGSANLGSQIRCFVAFLTYPRGDTRLLVFMALFHCKYGPIAYIYSGAAELEVHVNRIWELSDPTPGIQAQPHAQAPVRYAYKALMARLKNQFFVYSELRRVQRDHLKERIIARQERMFIKFDKHDSSTNGRRRRNGSITYQYTAKPLLL